jgi:UDP-GlcNAc:undecaprenyl-phosphate GlcNAc-1-phosphate transferase
MWTFALAFLISFAVATIGTPVARRLAIRWGVVDKPDERRIHAGSIPRLGGIAIAVGFFAPLTGLLVVYGDVGAMFKAEIEKVVGIYAGGLAILGLGVYDDIRGIGAVGKFSVQFAVAGLLYWLGFRMTALSTPFGGTVELGWLSAPVTFIWVAGVINAINLIDGLDGLAAGVALIAVSTIFGLSLMGEQPLMALFTSALGGALVGFLVFNFNPATIFMGDSGSMFIGFVLAAASLQTSTKSSTAVAIFAPLIALGLPLLDTAAAMIRRLRRREPMFLADRDHVHHRLLALGLTQRKAVLILYAFSVLLAGAAFAITAADGVQSAILLAALGLGVWVAALKLGMFSKRK